MSITPEMLERIIPVVISASIVVILFILGRILDAYIKSKEIRRNWYQKVLIDPNISKIETFYRDILAQAKFSIELLIDKSSGNYKDYIKLKVDEIEKFKVVKRAFDYDFVMVVRSNYPEIATELMEHLMEIEDCATSALDGESLKISDYYLLENNLMSKKYIIYQILYRPLVYSRPRLRDGIMYFWTIIKNIY